MCFNWSSVRKNGADQDEIRIQAIEKIARSMRALPQLLLSGGEPFLRQDVVKLVEIFYIYSGTRQITIPTNGMLTQEIVQSMSEMLTQCQEAYFNLNISLDGIGKDHDLSRGVEGCFDRLCETFRRLEKLRERHKRLVINFLTTIKKSNVEKIPDIVEYVERNFKANYHQLGLIRGDPYQKEEKDIEIEHVEKILSSIHKRRNNLGNPSVFYRLTPHVTNLIGKIISETRKQKKRCFHCLVGRKMVVITHDGKLLPCEPLWLEPGVRCGEKIDDYIMADLREFDYNVKGALRSSQAKRILKFIAEKRCYCVYGCAILNSIIYCPLMYPRVLKEILCSSASGVLKNFKARFHF